MKILRMTASFGRLDHETLELAGGLNVLTAPNEAGKSTWAAFLVSMLYGVDSSERASKTNLPVKTKYKPWSGAPMEGAVELEQGGRRITLERASRGRVPMGDFSARYTDTNEPVPGLTGENCGLVLLGVERSVFERSAFLGSRNLAVTQDAALEKRLASLVTTGDESVSFSESAQRLRDWKNRCQHNKTGLLPQKQAELGELDGRLAQIREAHRQDLALAAERDELQKKQLELTALVAAFKAQEAARRLAQKREAEYALTAAETRARDLQKKAEALPPRETLAAMARETELLDAELGRLPAAPPVLPPPPACPAVFAGLREEEILPRAQRDGTQFDRLAAVRRRPGVYGWLLLALGLALLAAGILLKNLLPGAAGGILMALGAVWLVLSRAQNRRYEAAQTEMDALLTAYGRRPRAEFPAFAAEYHEALLLDRRERERAEEARREALQKKQALMERQARLLGQISMFAPGAASIPDARRALAAANALHDEAAAARRDADAAARQLAAIRAALGDLKEAPAPAADVTGRDPRAVTQELLQLNSRLADVRSRLDLSRGRVDALGDPAALSAQRERLLGELAALQERFDALSLAEQTLAAANGTLQTRFAPRLGELAGELMARLTGSRYDRVFLESDLSVSAREKGELAQRQLLSLSCGTADQLYLAVRLAVCRLVLGDEAPLILDDALVNFDDERLKLALAVLREEARTRQILLFTCQNRERAALAQG